MFFKRRLRVELIWVMIVFNRAFQFCFIGIFSFWSLRGTFLTFPVLFFLFSRLFCPINVSIFWRWRTDVFFCFEHHVCCSTSTFVRDPGFCHFLAGFIRCMIVVSVECVTESCERYVHCLRLVFLDLLSFVINCGRLVSEVIFKITIHTGYVSGWLVRNDRFDLGCLCSNMCELAKLAKHRLMNHLWRISQQDTYQPCWKKGNFH